MGVKIQFTQGLTVGTVGEALEGSTATPVVAKDGNPIKGDRSIYRWTWIDVPTASALPLGDFGGGTITQIEFTPDVPGDYHLLVQRTDSNGFTTIDKRVFRVRLASGRALLSFDAEAPALNFDGQTRGWKPDIEEWLLYLDSLSPGGAPGGLTGEMQYRNGSVLAGTPNLTVDSGTGDIVHEGKPQHRETEALFEGSGDAYGHARAAWKGAQTTSAADTTLLTTNIPNAIGDCHVTVTWEATVSAASGGGNLVQKCVFRRNGGTMVIVNDASRGDAGDLTIAVSMKAAVVDNQNVALVGNGLAGANVNWTVSAHIQVTVEAA